MKTSSVGAELFHGKWQTGERKNERTEEQKDKQQKADRLDEANSRISQLCERT